MQSKAVVTKMQSIMAGFFPHSDESVNCIAKKMHFRLQPHRILSLAEVY